MDRAKLMMLAGYNTFFWVCFWMFCYWTFPYERIAAFLTDKVAESGVGYTLEIGELAPYWISGVALKDVKVHKTGSAVVTAPSANPAAPDDALKVREAHARVGLLGLLFGSKSLTFDALLEQGEIEGSYEEDGESKHVVGTLAKIDLAKLGVVESLLSLPVKGSLEGDFDLSLAKEPTKSGGTVKLRLKALTIGDGQAKLKMGGMGGLTIDPVDVGDVTMEFDVKDGVGLVRRLSANGQDVELTGSGEVRFADPVARSRLDVLLNIRFTDAYKNKSSRTKAMFSLLEGSAMPQVRAAKTPEGGLAYRVTGMLATPRAVPAGRTAASRPGSARRSMANEAPPTPVPVPAPASEEEDDPE